MKRPSFQFYPADWRKDAALQSCSIAARGIWIEMLCVAHECVPYGHLVVNGKAMTETQIGRLCGVGEKDARKLIAELLDAGVCFRDEVGAIFSKRMIEDEDLRERRAAGGKAGSEHGSKGASHGAKGGRPKKEITPQETPLDECRRGVIEPPKEPPPSSSSSVNPSLSVAIAPESAPPLAEKPRSKSQTFTSWLTEIRASGQKPVSAYQPVWEYAQRAGIPEDWIELAWLRFRERYERDEKARKKRYTDWRRVFLNAIEGNWFGLWCWSEKDQTFRLTTTGMQAENALRGAA